MNGFFQSITAHEVFMFLTVFILFLILGIFFYYNKIQLLVQEQSNCVRESKLTQQNGSYNITAKVMNRPAFEVVYDTVDKSTNVQCACADGTAESVFTNIPYYDMKSTTPDRERVQFKDKLLCNCETSISANASDKNVSYYGEPGITRFMYDQKNTGFFDNILYGPDYEYNK